MKKAVLLSTAAAIGIAILLAAPEAQLNAQQPAVSIGAADLGGVVTSASGPEAGVWVIAETTDLPTKFVKIVVTDDQGRYVLPELPKASYNVWVRGCGMVYAGLQAAHPDWLRDGKVRTLMQIGLERNQKMGDVPFVMDFAKNDDDKRVLRLLVGWTIMGRPYLAPPGIPEDRKLALRRAFDATMKDPAFLEDAGKQRLDIASIPGEQIDSFLADAYATPKPLVERAGKILAQSQ